MLPSINRLPGYRIPEILKEGQRFQEGPFTLIVSKKELGDAIKAPRLTVIVPVRLSKKSSHRNRTKRLIREAIQQNLPLITVTKDAIVIVNKLLDDEKTQDIAPIITELLEKGGFTQNSI